VVCLGGDIRLDQKDMCLKEIGLCAQFMLSSQGLIVNIIGEELCDHFMSTRIFNLTLNEIFIQALNIMKKMTTHTIWSWPSIHIGHVVRNLQEMHAKLK